MERNGDPLRHGIDVGDAADVIAKVIVARAGQLGYGPAPSGGSSSGGARPTAAPAPAAAPGSAAQAVAAAAAQAPAGTGGPSKPRTGQTVAVLDGIDTFGRLKPQQVTYATDAIAGLLSKQGIVATRWHRTSPALDLSGAQLCTDAKTGSVLEPILVSKATDPDDGNAVWNTVSVQLIGFDCTTHVVHKIATKDNGAFNWQIAADRSIAAAVKEFFEPAK